MCKIFWGDEKLRKHKKDKLNEIRGKKPGQMIYEILKEVPLIDGHNDTPWCYRKYVSGNLDLIDLSGDTKHLEHPMHTDIPRLRAGGVGAQFWSVFAPSNQTDQSPVKEVLEQIDFVHRMVSRYSNHLELAFGAKDIKQIHSKGKIASLIGVEGGHCIKNSLGVLRMFYLCGARYLTLTYLKNTDWADSATDRPAHNGLASFGKDVVIEMNKMGMLIDLSHTSFKTMFDVLKISKAPVIFSHSASYTLTHHPRNVPDEVLKLVASNGGIVMVTFVSEYISQSLCEYKAAERAEQLRLEYLFPNEPQKVEENLSIWSQAHPKPCPAIADVVNHIDHIRKIAGIDHIGIGSDFDGFADPPIGLEDVSCYPSLLTELINRGYSIADIKKIAGLNFLRVFKDAEKIAKV